MRQNPTLSCYFSLFINLQYLIIKNHSIHKQRCQTEHQKINKMNPYKQQKEQFLKKYFCYPEQLKSAILSADSLHPHFDMVKKCDLKQVRNIKKNNELVRILDQCEYHLMANWSYLYKTVIRIYDWAGMYWTGTGLHIHFEWMTTSDIRTENYSFDDVEMTGAMWDYFYLQRRKILKQFYPDLTFKFVENEDFGVQLTDHELKPIVKHAQSMSKVNQSIQAKLINFTF